MYIWPNSTLSLELWERERDIYTCSLKQNSTVLKVKSLGTKIKHLNKSELLAVISGQLKGAWGVISS